MFQVSNYINAEESFGTPEAVVTACITAYKNWSQDCASWAKDNRDRVAELAKGSAKDCHIQIRKKFCAPLNRHWHRNSLGYYFLGGIVESRVDVLKSVQISHIETEVYTSHSKNKNKSFRFHVVRQGKNWCIKTVSINDGNGKWTNEYL